MANARGKSIDKTHLSIDNAEERGFIHRDYIAHCFRWSHVVRHLLQKQRYKTSTILDIGCGKEVPLAKLLYSNKMTGCTYIGVDVNKLDPGKNFNFGKFITDMHLFDEMDVCDIELPTYSLHFNKPDVITCFEVLEHVEPEHTVRMLKKIREMLADDGVAFISTPCFNGKAAGNHVNEITYEALGTLIQSLGFGINGVYGTFASQSDIEPMFRELDPAIRNLYQALKEYYDSNVLSTFMAPLFPGQSRNALWVLTVNVEEDQDNRVFPKWEQLNQPWTSSSKWHELEPGDEDDQA